MNATPYQMTVAMLRADGASSVLEIAAELVKVPGCNSHRAAKFSALVAIRIGMRAGTIVDCGHGKFDCVYPACMQVGRSDLRIAV